MAWQKAWIPVAFGLAAGACSDGGPQGRTNPPTTGESTAPIEFEAIWGPLYEPRESLGPEVPPLQSSTAARVLWWNEVMCNLNAIDHTPPGPDEDRIYGEQLGPGRTARAFAIVQIAIFDAANAIDGRYQSYTGLPTAPPGTSMDAAIAQAAYDALLWLYPSQHERLGARLAEDLALIPDGSAKDQGIELGHRAAAAIVALREDDGSDLEDPSWGVDYHAKKKPGIWLQDPVSEVPVALGAYWSEVEPFSMESSSQFRLPPPPALDSAEYIFAFDDVKRLGGDGITTPTERTQEQTVIGIYWSYDGTPSIGTPPRFYNQILENIVGARTDDPVETARILALANVAMGDAAIAAWDSKYFYDFWRPITAIRTADRDRNPLTEADADWTPLGAQASNMSGPNFTPPFPAYPSGHASMGSAMFEALRLVYGTDAISFTQVSDEFNGVTTDNEGVVRPLLPRTFPSLSAAEEEVARSRVYLGIHWEFDGTGGMTQGRQVADWVFGHLFAPIGDECLP